MTKSGICKMLKFIAFSIVFFGVFSSCSKKVTEAESAGTMAWEKMFGGKLTDGGNSVKQTSDGGFIIAGYYGDSYSDVYLIKTDTYGNLQWEKTYGPRGTHAGESVQQTSDGGYVIAGRTELFGTGNCNIYLIRTNSAGDTIWTRSIGEDSLEIAHSVEQSTDGGFIIAGCTHSSQYGDIYLVKTNVKGNVVWTKTIGGGTSDVAYSIKRTSDGGFIVTGLSSLGKDFADLFLLKINEYGETLWIKFYGGDGFDIGYSVQQTNDGGYVAVGKTNSFGNDWHDIYLIKVNGNGNLIWEKTFGGEYSDYAYSVQQTFDGGYIIAGLTQSFNEYYGYIIKTDCYGNEIWSQTYGETGWDGANSIQQTSDGGYIVAGYSNYDVWLFKIE